MNETFNLTLNQVIIMFIFLLIGYILTKKKILNKDAGSIVSKLLLWVFLPAMCFNSFSSNFDLSSLKENFGYIFVGIAVVLIEIAVGFILAKFITKDKFERSVYIYTIFAPNVGYFGYPLVLAVLGPEFLYKAMMFTIATNVAIYTLGYYILDETKTKVSFKSLLNPPIMAIALGMCVGLLKIPVPEIIKTALNNAQNCMAPMSMMLAGFVLAPIKLTLAFKNIKVYLVVLLRMVVIPLVFTLVLLMLNFEKDIIIIAGVMTAMPAGLNTIVFPAAKGLDASLGSQIAVISNLAALITVPIAVMLLMSV